MTFDLSPTEIRILGSLIEKEITTPEYYPLTLNSLIAACNQKSNRDPAMALDENAVVSALDSLKAKHLVWHVTGGARVTKYDHNLKNVLPLSGQETAVLCTLMLRGPRTLGEIRSRSERMHAFSSLDEVQSTLDALAKRADQPLVAEMPRAPGQKETRFTHLLSGMPPAAIAPQDRPVGTDVMPVQTNTLIRRVESLEEDVRRLREELCELKSASGVSPVNRASVDSGAGPA